MSPLLQSRLLRVMQDREVRRVGDNTPLYVNVRVLAATNEPLEKRMKEGTFREDLYYRLNVIAINLPSLRARKEDIPLLVSHFLRKKNNARGPEPFQITRQAMEVLCAHEWPGNVRELENAIERACALCEDHLIQGSDLPPSLQRADASAAVTAAGSASEPVVLSTGPDSSREAVYPFTDSAQLAVVPARPAPISPAQMPLKNFLREQELTYLNRALIQAGGDKEKTAQMLGISLATLYRKMAGETEA